MITEPRLGVKIVKHEKREVTIAVKSGCVQHGLELHFKKIGEAARAISYEFASTSFYGHTSSTLRIP